MKKNVVKLNESQLHHIIAESVKKIIKEYSGWHRLLTFDNAIAELHEAWECYCKGGSGRSLTTDDQYYVKELIDSIQNNDIDEQ